MQEQMIREVTAARPRFVVIVWVPTSWGTEWPAPDSRIYSWMKSFVLGQYKPVGVVDLISPSLTVYKWLEDATGYTVQSDFFIAVYERTGEGASPAGAGAAGL
jgi:hypothetical protein